MIFGSILGRRRRRRRLVFDLSSSPSRFIVSVLGYLPLLHKYGCCATTAGFSAAGRGRAATPGDEVEPADGDQRGSDGLSDVRVRGGEHARRVRSATEGQAQIQVHMHVPYLHGILWCIYFVELIQPGGLFGRTYICITYFFKGRRCACFCVAAPQKQRTQFRSPMHAHTYVQSLYHAFFFFF